ncbi:hypothetical protein HALA3H3_250022 [Halomonas sp. A3H3]|nr:hypothetical protein HALA3H3_250022 [Halomonas sp. A3H3]
MQDSVRHPRNGLALVRCLGGTGLEGLRDKSRTAPVGPPIYSDSEWVRLLELAQEEPHQLKAVQARFQQETGKCACTMTIKRAFKKSGVQL